MAVKMRVIGGPKEGVKMAPENGGTGTTLATSSVPSPILWVDVDTVDRCITDGHEKRTLSVTCMDILG